MNKDFTSLMTPENGTVLPVSKYLLQIKNNMNFDLNITSYTTILN